MNVCGGPLTNEELACAPGCLLAYLAKLLELALVLANSVAWWMEVEHGNHGVQRVPKAFHGPPKKTISQSVSGFFWQFR